MIDFRSYVERNQIVIDFVNDVTPGYLDKYVGTLDYACSRFHTILLRMSEDPLLADSHEDDLNECFEIIHNFFNLTIKLSESHWFVAPFIKVVLHFHGKYQIPKIKNLLDSIGN